ncbi:uncharacterized protein [Miscanthus floridulus]|uniref:uncharacterized protein n=1 Tax=Miscanthus floridulus TaxID=154761 RepID=UPI003458AB0D
MAELEHWVEATCRESQDQAIEAATAWAEGQRAAEWATTAEQGLEAAKVHQAETEVGLRASLANTEAALQEVLAALELEQIALASEWAALESARKALEAERRARSEVDQEVLALQGRVMGMEDASARLREQLVALLSELGGKVKTLKATLGHLFFVESKGDVVLQVSLPLDGTRLDGRARASVESACRVSQEQAAKAWAEGQRAAEWATTAEQGLEAAKVRQVETEARLRASLANTEAAL